jgi:hypothetical protein
VRLVPCFLTRTTCRSWNGKSSLPAIGCSSGWTNFRLTISPPALSVVPEDERAFLFVEAQSRFGELKPQCPRVKTMDLRIASIALVTDSPLLSRNLRDFRQVPGLSVEEWTIP